MIFIFNFILVGFGLEYAIHYTSMIFFLGYNISRVEVITVRSEEEDLVSNKIKNRQWVVLVRLNYILSTYFPFRLFHL